MKVPYQKEIDTARKLKKKLVRGVNYSVGGLVNTTKSLGNSISQGFSVSKEKGKSLKTDLDQRVKKIIEGTKDKKNKMAVIFHKGSSLTEDYATGIIEELDTIAEKFEGNVRSDIDKMGNVFKNHLQRAFPGLKNRLSNVYTHKSGIVGIDNKEKGYSTRFPVEVARALSIDEIAKYFPGIDTALDLKAERNPNIYFDGDIKFESRMPRESAKGRLYMWSNLSENFEDFLLNTYRRLFYGIADVEKKALDVEVNKRRGMASFFKKNGYSILSIQKPRTQIVAKACGSADENTIIIEALFPVDVVREAGLESLFVNLGKIYGKNVPFYYNSDFAKLDEKVQEYHGGGIAKISAVGDIVYAHPIAEKDKLKEYINLLGNKYLGLGEK